MSINNQYGDYEEDFIPQRRRRSNDKQHGIKKKRKKSPLQKFFTVVLIILIIYIIALGMFAIAAHLSEDPNDKPIDVLNDVIGVKLPERTNFLLMCTDEAATRTDTIMLGCYNSVTNRIDIISIPRDTVVTVSDEHFEQMQLEYPWTDSPDMQINHIHHFIGPENGPQVLTDEVESLFDINIDYYVRVNFDAFRYFVDSIGGIDFYVPCDMNYDDPSQDLAIHLTQGLQTIDGDKAEQLVRFRKNNDETGYPNGDIGRIEVQQAFLKELVKKSVNTNIITSNPKAYITTFYRYVTTNAGISDMLKYASKLKDIDVNNMTTYILPGEAHNRYYYDEAETTELIYNIFKKPSDQIMADSKDEQSNESMDSKSAEIQVLNGGYKDGKAAEIQAQLNADGYNVTDIATYNDTKEDKTRIYVNQDGLGEDLLEYFNNADIIVNDMLTGDYDIVIVIGAEE